mmetsp:Transcript_6243/g.11537  ORF Transcript_6243/g.11537 Transcript_6243/m.11537 type:complete len:245 (+) Transcript_6243:397-1131(+)
MRFSSTTTTTITTQTTTTQTTTQTTTHTERHPFAEHARRSAEHVARVIYFRPYHMESQLSDPVHKMSIGKYTNDSELIYHYTPKTTFDSLFGPLKKNIWKENYIQKSHAELFGYQLGRCVYYNVRGRRFKFGAFWIYQNRTVGAFLEGGARKDIRLLKRLVAKKVPVQDIEIEYMRKRGLDWARESLNRVLNNEVWTGFDPKYAFIPKDDGDVDPDKEVEYAEIPYFDNDPAEHMDHVLGSEIF